MAGASLELQKAVIERLKADTTMAGLVSGRVYDKPPSNATFPYVEYRPVQKLPDRFECGTNWDVFVSLDVWSRATGTPQMTNICEAIEESLHDADEDGMSLETARLVLIEHEQTRYLDDPDGITQHGIVEIHASIDVMELTS